MQSRTSKQLQNNNFFSTFMELKRVVVTGLGAVTPLGIHLLEAGVFLGLTQIHLDVVDVSTDGSVDAVLGDEDASTQVQAFAEVALPQAHCLGVSYGCECVIQKNFGDCHVYKGTRPKRTSHYSY